MRAAMMKSRIPVYGLAVSLCSLIRGRKNFQAIAKLRLIAELRGDRCLQHPRRRIRIARDTMGFAIKSGRLAAERCTARSQYSR
jgi:hypothetical protein